MLQISCELIPFEVRRFYSGKEESNSSLEESESELFKTALGEPNQKQKMPFEIPNLLPLQPCTSQVKHESCKIVEAHQLAFRQDPARLAVSVSKINVDLSIADIYAALLIGKAMPVAKVKPQKPKTSGAAKKKQNVEISLCLEVTLNLTSEFGQYSEFSAA